MRQLLARAIAACLLLAPALPLRAQHTYPLNLDPVVEDGLNHFYNLDFSGAEKRFQQVIVAHPQDPMAYAYLLTATTFQALYGQDLLDTTYYAHENFLSSGHRASISPDVQRQIEQLTAKATGLADQRIQHNGQDKDAYFARSYARGIHAAYITFADHSFASAARQGLASRSDSEQVLKLDPDYIDAKMAVGIQQYAVASLPRFLRMVVGIAGIGGSKEHGLALLRECAANGTLTRVESQTALSLFLRHDQRYNDAYAVAQHLAETYPHDFLFRLEQANVMKDAGHGPEAIAIYRRVIADAAHPGYFVDARLQLAYFGLADTERGQGEIPAAEQDYERAMHQPTCSDWMRRRAALNAGKMLDLLHKRGDALKLYNAVEAPGGDASLAAEARKLVDKPYTGH